MRYALALAALPAAAMWAAWPAKQSQPIAVRAVATEGIRVARMDASTFAARWRVVSDLPPAVVRQQDIGEGAGKAASGAKPRAWQGRDEARTLPSPMSRKRASLRADICARHGMKRVNYGKRWRCRR